MTLPSGRTIAYGRDARGRPTSQAYGGHEASFTYAGDTARPATIGWTPPGGGTGQQLAYTWDGDMPGHAPPPPGWRPARYEYGYDAELRLSSEQPHRAAPTSTPPPSRATPTAW